MLAQEGTIAHPLVKQFSALMDTFANKAASHQPSALPWPAVLKDHVSTQKTTFFLFYFILFFSILWLVFFLPLSNLIFAINS